MMDLRSLRARLRKCLEQLAAARMIGDSDAVSQADEFVKAAKLDLASALVKEMKHGLSKADESVGKSAQLPKGGARQG